jgi:hypothetical protein
MEITDIDPAYSQTLAASPEVKKKQARVSTDMSTALFYIFFAVSLFLICCFGLIAEA